MPLTARPSRPCSDRRRALPPPLRLNLRVTGEARHLIEDTFIGLPDLFGSPICICSLPKLTAWRGKLLTRSPDKGIPVHAASFIRRRKVTFEDELVHHPRVFRLILTHELFHFVWARLGNAPRAGFSALLQNERQQGSTGTLGESSDVSRARIDRRQSGSFYSRSWTDYVCESFCDTGAWLYSGTTRSRWFTLPTASRIERSLWFNEHFAGGIRC